MYLEDLLRQSNDGSMDDHCGTHPPNNNMIIGFCIVGLWPGRYGKIQQ